MIKRWKIANFKSIRDETELELAPLTIFAGANSSGKSTVLQSILLIAQTLQHKVSSKSVVLNGSLSKLGQFRDLISYDGYQNQISIGWLCEPVEKGDKKINWIKCKLSFDALPDDPEYDPPFNWRRASGDVHDALQLQPRLHGFKIEANFIEHDFTDDNNLSMYLSSASNKSDYYIKDYYIKTLEDMSEMNSNIFPENITDIDLLKAKERIKINIDDNCFSNIHKKYPTFYEVIVNKIDHFLPKRLILSKPNDMKIATAFISILFLLDKTLNINKLLDIEFPTHIQEKVVLPVATLINFFEAEDFHLEVKPRRISKTFMKKLRNIPEKEISLKFWADFIQRLHLTTRKNISRMIHLSDPPPSSLHKSEIMTNLKWLPTFSEIKSSASEYKEIEYESKSLSSAMEYLDDFFSKSVKYLGPLRSEPKSVYPIGTLVDPADVGVRGEQTAAVLYMHRKTLIKYLPASNFPPSNSESLDIDRKSVSKSLMDAVCEWAQHLGVIEDIRASDHGKLGHNIKVGQDRKIRSDIPNHIEYDDVVNPDYSQYLNKIYDNSQDLTHVGVGVSQVLPILVMGLLSKEDTTLIFEQPELHLHPLVQTRLADFFLSMALLNKQCIIETHSEHLIHRLRYRTAAASLDQPLTDMSRIYFVEKNKGTSCFQEVVVNEYGAIQNWPSGFFDQSYTETENILMASIKKRKKMRKDK